MKLTSPLTLLLKGEGKTKEWFENWFDSQDYLDLYKHRDDNDAKKIVSLIIKNIPLKKNSKVLDLPCGNGRHSVLFAKKGFDVTGIDLSPFLISQARKRLRKEYSAYKNRLHFETGDMRKLNHTKEFSLAVNLFTSFGYFEKHVENEKVIRTISNSLQRNGWFVFDFLNTEYLKRNLVSFDKKKMNGKLILQHRYIKGNFIYKKIFLIGKSLANVNEFTERIYLYSLKQVEKMFERSSLKIKNIFGDYAGSKFNIGASPRLIIFARKN